MKRKAWLLSLLLIAVCCHGARAGTVAPRLAGISIFGNHTTQEYVILRELGFHIGETVDAEQLSAARARLEELDFIAYADLQTKRTGPGEVHLLVQLEETPRFSRRQSLEYERRHDGWTYGWEAALGNVRGRGETLSLRGRVGARQIYELRWSNPRFFGPLELGAALQTSWEGYDFEYGLFRFEDIRAGLSLWRHLPWQFRAEADYVWRRVHSNDPVAAGITGDGVDPAIRIGLFHDSRDRPGYPTRGLLGQANVHFGGVGAERLYCIREIRLAAWQPLLFDAVVGARGAFRGGLGRLPAYEQFYLGGAHDLRGLPFGDERGDAGWLATVEIRRPFLLVPLPGDRLVGFGLHLFHDLGRAWDHGENPADLKPRHATGLGIHIMASRWNFRCEWARGDDREWRFMFEDQFTF